MFQSDESLIIEFLAGFPRTFVSGTEIGKRAGGRKRFAAEPDWARSILLRLEVEGVLESDAYGHFRLKPGAAALKKYGSSKFHRERRCCDKINTYVLTMTSADDEKPFAQLVREVVTQSFPAEDPDSKSHSQPG